MNEAKTKDDETSHRKALFVTGYSYILASFSSLAWFLTIFQTLSYPMSSNEFFKMKVSQLCFCSCSFPIQRSVPRNLQQALHIRRALRQQSGIRLPWCLSGKDFTCQCTGHGFNPWFRNIPQAAGQLNPWAIKLSLCSRASVQFS